MESFKEFKKEFCVSIPERLNEDIIGHLIRDDGQEDLLFGIWYPSIGKIRYTALVQSIIMPVKGDRKIHGNVSFNCEYFKRVCQLAHNAGGGVVFMHSHTFPGWQHMSHDDVVAELKISPTVETITNLPLVGLTVGSDGTWSGRGWLYGSSRYKLKWAKSVKVLGKDFKIYSDINQKKHFSESIYLKRTISVWGPENQEKLMNLRIGIIGLGSVGSIVAETLARIGIQELILIDYDKIEEHNLDRVVGVTKKDIGLFKVEVIAKSIKRSSPLKDFKVTSITRNISDQHAYKSALDCDLLFCCADKPRARYILNHLAYAHLITVFNGGILAEIKNNKLQFADWELSIIGPGYPCMQCISAYKSSDVMLEIEGRLGDPEYIRGLSKESIYKQNQNVMPFSMNLASFEVLQMIAYVTDIAELKYYGIQRYRFKQGRLSNLSDKVCHEKCDFNNNIAKGDATICPILTKIL